MVIDEFNPTHTLLIRRVDDESGDEISTTNNIIQSFSKPDYSVHIYLSEEQIRSDYPEIIGEIRQKFDYSETSECYIGTFPDCESALLSLLSIQTWHRFVSLVSLTIIVDDTPILHYVPDHNVFEVDVTAIPGSEDEIERMTEGTCACFLPKTTLAEWKSGGTTHEITPPSLCINQQSCFRLSALQEVALNKRNQTLSLTWSTSNRYRTKLIDRVFGLFGPSRPTKLQFEDEQTFNSVTATFLEITEKMKP